MLNHARWDVRAEFLSAFRRNFYLLPEIYPAQGLSGKEMHPKVSERHCAGLQRPSVFCSVDLIRDRLIAFLLGHGILPSVAVARSVGARNAWPIVSSNLQLCGSLNFTDWYDLSRNIR